MMPSDIIAALEPVVAALAKVGATYRIGGSVASSALGVPRSTLDVDLVCDLKPSQVAGFASALEDAYYVDADMIREAIRDEASFNLIHLATVFKIDVFVRKSSPWDREAFSRSTRRPLDVSGKGPEFELTTAEDIVLHKLIWFRLSEGVSERQWRDAVGVIAVQQRALDREYLKTWARALGVTDLLDRAFAEADSALREG